MSYGQIVKRYFLDFGQWNFLALPLATYLYELSVNCFYMWGPSLSCPSTSLTHLAPPPLLHLGPFMLGEREREMWYGMSYVKFMFVLVPMEVCIGWHTFDHSWMGCAWEYSRSDVINFLKNEHTDMEFFPKVKHLSNKGEPRMVVVAVCRNRLQLTIVEADYNTPLTL